MTDGGCPAQPGERTQLITAKTEWLQNADGHLVDDGLGLNRADRGERLE